jgi:hypothetical protein
MTEDPYLAEWAVFQRRVAADCAAGRRRRQGAEQFVTVPLWWAQHAAKLARSPATLVLIELLRARWQAQSTTFVLSNVRLHKLGVSREIKRRVLRDLARGKGRMITVEQKPGRAVRITTIGW